MDFFAQCFTGRQSSPKGPPVEFDRSATQPVEDILLFLQGPITDRSGKSMVKVWKNPPLHLSSVLGLWTQGQRRARY